MRIVIYCGSNQVVCFEGPLDIFGGMVEVVCIHDIGEKPYMNSLWETFFQCVLRSIALCICLLKPPEYNYLSELAYIYAHS
jgi:hypothetical protein